MAMVNRKGALRSAELLTRTRAELEVAPSAATLAEVGSTRTPSWRSQSLFTLLGRSMVPVAEVSRSSPEGRLKSTKRH